MRLHKSTKLAAAVAVAIAFSASQAFAQGEIVSAADELSDWDGVTLKFAQHYPATHLLTKEGGEYFIKRAGELTGGKLKFEFYPGQQLGKSKDHLSLARNKVAAITGIVPNYTPGEMPLSAVLELPGAYDKSSTGTELFQAMMQEGPIRDEFEKVGVVPLWGTALQPYLIVTTKTKVVEPGDLKGLKLRVTGASRTLAIKSTGGVPVAIPTVEARDAMARGTLDGAASGPNGVIAYSLHEVNKYALAGTGVGSTMTAWVINADIMASLPEPAQRILKEVGAETGAHLAKLLDEEEDQIINKTLPEAGVEVAVLDKAGVAKWKAAFSRVQESWVADMKKRGLASEEVVKQRDSLAN